MRPHPSALKIFQTAVVGLLAALALSALQAATAQASHRPCHRTACPAPGDTTPPSASWKTPIAGATVSGTLWESANSGISGPCEATAADNTGVSKVVFYVDATLLNTEAIAPYNCKFDSTAVADGSHTLKAVAYDAAGNTTSSTRTVTVRNAAEPPPPPPPPSGDTIPPAAAWTSPSEGATVSGMLWEASNSGASGPCEISASDAGGMSKVMFSVDGAPLNQESIAPWNCKLDTTTLTDGSHVLKAVAYDAAGNTTTVTRTVSVQNGTRTPDTSRTLVFEDHFDGTSLNLNNWTPYNGPGHGGNGYRRPSAFSVANGMLAVTATWDGSNITSGGMAGRANYLYGRFEARVRTESDTSLQTSGIVMTWPQSNTWPSHGELDFYETGRATVSRTPFYSYLHWMNGTSGGSQTQITHNADAREWHVMTMDWDPSAIRVYRDGVLIGSLTDPSKIPSVMHHFSIQLDAMSNNALPGPVRMYVDWVKVYK